MRTITSVVLLLVAGLVGLGRSPNGDNAGPPAQPLAAVTGQKSCILTPGYHRIESAAVWERLWNRHSTGEAKPNRYPHAAPEMMVDFSRCMVLAVFGGAAINMCGYEVKAIDESAESVRVRMVRLSVQTDEASARGNQPWGVFVLPKSKKALTIELDTQSVIRGPPVWTKVADLKPGDTTTEK